MDRFENERGNVMELESLGFVEGILVANGRKAKGGAKVLDWDKAAEIVAGTKGTVWAGLAEDWEYTSGIIGDNGKQTKPSYQFYGYSRWATPVVVVGNHWGEGIECWKYADKSSSPECPKGWGAKK